MRLQTFSEESSMTTEEMEICVIEYGEDIFRFCCFLTGSRDKGEDLYQDTFLTATEIKQKITYEDARKFLLGIAANLWKNQWRKAKRRQKVTSSVEFKDDHAFERNLGQEMVHTSDTLELYIEQEARELVRREVDALPEKYRIVVLLYYSVDLSTREIAEQLHISKGTVTSRLLRARERIKKGLEAKGYEI